MLNMKWKERCALVALAVATSTFALVEYVSASGSGPTTVGYRLELENVDTGDIELLGYGDAIYVRNPSESDDLEVTVYNHGTRSVYFHTTLSPADDHTFELPPAGGSGGTVRVLDQVGLERTTGDVDVFCGWDCFPAGTLVATAVGRVAVESLAVGDVLAGAARGVVESVLPTRSRELVQLTVDGESVRVTRGHRILTAGRGWVAASEVLEGESVQVTGPTGARRHAAVERVAGVALDSSVAVYDVRLASAGEIRLGALGLVAEGPAAIPAR